MDFKNYYQVLGLERTASEDDVRKAYRQLAAATAAFDPRQHLGA